MITDGFTVCFLLFLTIVGDLNCGLKYKMQREKQRFRNYGQNSNIIKTLSKQKYFLRIVSLQYNSEMTRLQKKSSDLYIVNFLPHSLTARLRTSHIFIIILSSISIYRFQQIFITTFYQYLKF